MIPKTRERMRDQLSKWGYPLYLIEVLTPWGLIDCYNTEKRKRAAPFLTKTILDISVEDVLDSPIKLKRTPKKYRGVLLPKNPD